jgi:hypothetical protein
MARSAASAGFSLRIVAVLAFACAMLLDGHRAFAQDSEAAGADNAVSEENASVEISVPLLERSPFDRITLDAANKNAVIETVLIDFPNRRKPDPRPTSGSLEFRRLSHPSIPYSVPWSAIAKIELFEEMILSEAERLTQEGKFGDAFNHLAFLTANYPQLPGLEQALQSHLWREASALYAAKNREEAWPALLALYARNPQFPRLANAVQAVSDDLIKERLEAGDYASARTLVDGLASSFAKLPLTNVARWRSKFTADANAQLERARRAFAAQEYGEAREAVTYARSIMPDIPGGAELWKEIQSTAPEIRVGVTQSADAGVMSRTPTWAVARVSDLVNPRLVEMVDFGAEGGSYQSRWSKIAASDDGLRTTIRLNPEAISRGLAPGAVALRLVEMATDGADRSQSDFAALTAGVMLADGSDVQILWRRPHVRPEAFLQIPLRWIAGEPNSSGLWFNPLPAKRDGRERPFERTGEAGGVDGSPRLVVETEFADDEEAIEALIRGDIDVIDRAPPWQLARVEKTTGVKVSPYRLPTIHVLIPNYANPLLDMREFRRALNYGIDSEGIVRDILLGGETRAGFRTLSGPFPAGVALNDPAGYAYNPEIAARPYEPRLAALLASVARSMLKKRDEAARKAEEVAAKAEQPAAEIATPPAESAAGDETTESTDNKTPDEAPGPPTPLVLAHSTDPVAKLACQAIKIQLDQIGIPVKLVEFSGSTPPSDVQYDLLYMELAVWEPVYDARRLLSATGVAGRASAMMAAALDQLDRAQNWNQARDQLRELHRIAHYDLPLIPLWQTVNYFAHRDSLTGVGIAPVTLYQNLPNWRKSFE